MSDQVITSIIAALATIIAAVIGAAATILSSSRKRELENQLPPGSTSKDPPAGASPSTAQPEGESKPEKKPGFWNTSFSEDIANINRWLNKVLPRQVITFFQSTIGLLATYLAIIFVIFLIAFSTGQRLSKPKSTYSNNSPFPTADTSKFFPPLTVRKIYTFKAINNDDVVWGAQPGATQTPAVAQSAPTNATSTPTVRPAFVPVPKKTPTPVIALPVDAYNKVPWVSLPLDKKFKLAVSNKFDQGQDRSYQYSLRLDGSIPGRGQTSLDFAGIALYGQNDPDLNKDSIIAANAWVYIPESAENLENHFYGAIQGTTYSPNGESFISSSPDFELTPGEWTQIHWTVSFNVLYHDSINQVDRQFISLDNRISELDVIVRADRPYNGSIFFDNITIFSNQ
jgi:hypothetical protein